MIDSTRVAKGRSNVVHARTHELYGAEVNRGLGQPVGSWRGEQICWGEGEAAKGIHRDGCVHGVHRE